MIVDLMPGPTSRRLRSHPYFHWFLDELGEFESGVLAHLFGALPAAVLGGMVCLATVFTVALLSPALRNLNLEELRAVHEVETHA